MPSLRDVLKMPRMYQLFQEAGGFFGARLRFLRRSGLALDGAWVIDVGCGPGFIRRHLPDSVQYFGFDTDQRYIDYAKAHNRQGATYLCQIFDASSVAITGPADVVMMNGLLHHLDDATARSLIADAAACLKPGGCIVTLDGCYRPGQSWVVKILLDGDRGEHVRTQEGYLDLFAGTGLAVSAICDGKVSRVPYDFIWITARK